MIYTRRTRILKKKIISLVFGLFMAVFSVFSLSSCSLVSTNNVVENEKTVLKVGDAELSKSDVISSFYTYYQNNSSYFSYYDNETIEESFYTWAIIKEVINQKSATALYDAQTNPTGYIVYTAENEKNVWKNTYEYIYNQVNTYEKSVYKSAGYAEENYPAWLSAEETKETESSFESYISTMPTDVSTDKSQAVKKSTDEQILNYISAQNTNLKKYLFEHLIEVDENDNETRKAIKDIISEEQTFVNEIQKDKFIKNARSQAYIDYIAGLVNTANSEGKQKDEATLFNEEVIRVYNAYYESEITSLLQKYYLDEYLISGEDTPLTEKAIAEAFLNDYYSDYQKYQFEDAYITTMTSKDGASLVLYHYDGQNYFFTVQHILVKNDDHITEKIKELTGYTDGSYDYDASGSGSVYEQFVTERKNLTDTYFMASAVNKDNVSKSIELKSQIETFANYYFYDKDRAESVNNGYIRLVEIDGKYYEDINADGAKDSDVEIDKSKVLYLSTDEEIMKCYQYNFDKWVAYAEEYAGYIDAKNETGKANLIKEHEDISYVFETVEEMKAASKTDAEINQKIASYLFIQLEWIFSSDSLGNEISNKMGYVMSNYPDEHGSWVAEFADGARELLQNIKTSQSKDSVQEGITSILNAATVDVSLLTNKIISTYGYHIIKVEDIFECGSSVIDVNAIETALGLNENQDIDLSTKAHLDAVIKEMKETYVCSGSNQTVYDYYFDKVYTGFVGSSWLGDTSENATSGTYFLKLEYEWIYELYKANQIEYVDKMTYEELLESVS